MGLDHHPRMAFGPARYSCWWPLMVALVVRAAFCISLDGSESLASAQQQQLRLVNRPGNVDQFLAEKLAQPGDLTLRKTSLPEALFAIGELWGLNLVVGEEVQGQVNCDFQNAPLGEILNTVLLSNGYSYRPFGRSLVIVRLTEMGDINPLFETATIPVRIGDPADLIEGASVFNSPRGKTKAVPSARSLLVVDYPDRVALIRDFISGINNSSGTANGGPGNGEIQSMQLQPQYIPAAMLKDAIAAALSKDGKVIVIEGENRIVVVDLPYYLRLAQQVMEQVDHPRPQVRITAYIYDVGLQDFESLGFNWGNAVKGRVDADGNPMSAWSIDSLTTVPFTGNAVGGAMTFLNLSRNFDLNATIEALSTCKDSRLLADPNVVVIDNEAASVAIISEIPYQQLTQTQQGGNIGTTAFREAGVKLNVLPRISQDGTIQMLVEPEFSRLTGYTPETKQPIIDRRTAKTSVRVYNGQTVVIGGLRQRTDVGTFNGIPFLKDIPYLGVMFRSRETDVRESELLVFLKPEIVNYAEILKCREAAALGTSHKYLDQIPTGETPVIALPPVHSPQGNPQPGQWEEVPAPATKNNPPTVEESSKGLALAAQRTHGNYDPSTRPNWQQTTGGSPSLQSAPQTHRPAIATSAAPAPNTSSMAAYKRLPPVQSQPVLPVTIPSTSLPVQKTQRYQNYQPAEESISYRQAPQQDSPNHTPQPSDSLAPSETKSSGEALLTKSPPSNQAPRYSTPDSPVVHETSLVPSEDVPAATASPAATDSGKAPEDENPLRTRGYRLDAPDEIRSATWINNVFRY